MRLLVGVIISLAVGVGCRVFDIPVPSPPVLPGALLVVAMTIGYSGADRFFSRTTRLATTKHSCGGPSGETAVSRTGGDRKLPVPIAGQTVLNIDETLRAKGTKLFAGIDHGTKRITEKV